MSAGTVVTGNTIQADVEPGDKTGIYYITICNLPFGTTWQALKDWARAVCEIDHVEVFPTSTSGWVRVKGKNNFKRAWRLLNGGSFNGRSIIASDKNRSEPIKIKELIDVPSRAQPEDPYPASPYAGSPPSHDMQSQQPPSYHSYTDVSVDQTSPSYYSPTSPVVSYSAQSVAYTNYGSPMSRRSAMTNSNTDPSFSGAAYYSSDVSPYGDSYSNSPYWQTHNSPEEYRYYRDAGYGETYYDYYEQSESSSYVETERRKVVLRHIERKARRDEVTSWVQKKLGSTAAAVCSIDIPHEETSGRLKGHGYIIFKNASAANKAVEALDQKKFQKGCISARLTVEGVVVSRPTKSSSKKEKDAKDNGPVIVNGSSVKAPSEKRR